MPVDVQTDVFDNYEPAQPELPGYNPPSDPDREQLEGMLSLLSGAKAPIICAGGGIISSNSSKLLRTIAEKMAYSSCYDHDGNWSIALGS